MKSSRFYVISLTLFSALGLTACDIENVDVGHVLSSGVAVAQASKGFNFDEELEIGGTIAAKLAATYEVNGDLRARQYVNLIGQTVAARSLRPDVFPRILILDDDVPNAYACPGGYMFVTTGLLKICRDESELAGILGHEFAHVARKHTLHALRWKRAVSVSAKEAAGYGSKELSQAYGGFKGAIDKGIDNVVGNRHGTAAESEADEYGAYWAAMAGYDPRGLGRVIERLPTGENGRWLEAFSVYKNGDTRAQRIVKELKARKVNVKAGQKNAERYKRELAAVL